jgi:hypothetical protein
MSAASTLPPTPSYNPNIPIISSAGGTSLAYKDPNSPESIMKKTTLLQAQTSVDTSYDVDLKKVTKDEKKEGFGGFRKRRGAAAAGADARILYFFIFLILFILYLRRKTIHGQAKIALLLLAAALIVFTVVLLQNGGR